MSGKAPHLWWHPVQSVKSHIRRVKNHIILYIQRVKSHSGTNQIIICLTHANVWGVNGEALQLHAVYKKLYFYYESRKNPYQVLQVTCTASERAMKSEVRMIKSLSP